VGWCETLNQRQINENVEESESKETGFEKSIEIESL
jgi:hypothetical protein